MRVSILGTRGIPANYGGFETFAEQVSIRLVARGHDVTVYCRSANYTDHAVAYRGVRRVVLPSIHTKYLDSITHGLLSSLHFALRNRGDVALYCSSGNSFFSWIPRLAGAKVFLHTDGLEWERAKWNWAGKLVLKLAERLAAWFPHRLISDSRVIQRYYQERFGKGADYIAYGADVVERGTGRDLLAEVGVEPEEYFLFVSRLEPENNAHVLVRAFEGVRTRKKLLVVGSAPFATDYIKGLKETQDPRIVFPGALYGDTYAALRANAYAYINAMAVGGTHPAILEAMAAGNCVLVSDIAYNVETVGEAGVPFRNGDVEDLRRALQWAEDHPTEVERYRGLAVERIRAEFSWDRIVDEYERGFTDALTN